MYVYIYIYIYESKYTHIVYVSFIIIAFVMVGQPLHFDGLNVFAPIQLNMCLSSLARMLVDIAR